MGLIIKGKVLKLAFIEAYDNVEAITNKYQKSDYWTKETFLTAMAKIVAAMFLVT